MKHAIICAAGLGLRLQLGMTKCLVEINHKKLIDYQLELLKNVPEIRIVVGFQAEQVIAHVRKIRSDITFIKNHCYKTTSSSYSAYIGTRDLREPFLLFAGYFFIKQDSFVGFLRACKSNQSLVGITKAKSQYPIFVELDQKKRIVGFERYRNTGFEWPCIAFLSKIVINKYKKYIYENLIASLPINSYNLDCYEIDTKDDLELVLQKYESRIPYRMSSLHRSV